MLDLWYGVPVSVAAGSRGRRGAVGQGAAMRVAVVASPTQLTFTTFGRNQASVAEWMRGNGGHVHGHGLDGEGSRGLCALGDIPNWGRPHTAQDTLVRHYCTERGPLPARPRA